MNMTRADETRTHAVSPELIIGIFSPLTAFT